MTILEKFEKQPGATQFYDISLVDFLAQLGTTATAPPVATWSSDAIVQKQPAAWITPGVLRIWASGGVDKAKYKATMIVTCDNGWVEEHEIVLNVKET